MATLSNYRTDAPDALYTEKEINKRKKTTTGGWALLVSLKVHEMHDINIDATENYLRL